MNGEPIYSDGEGGVYLIGEDGNVYLDRPYWSDFTGPDAGEMDPTESAGDWNIDDAERMT